MVNLLYYGGLRLHELVLLRVENLNREAGMITFRRKGGSIHQLQIQNPRQVFFLLFEYIKNREVDSQYVFANRKGGKISIRAMHYEIERFFQQCACPTMGLTPHSFRKACATNLYKKTKDLLFVRDYLNHVDAKVTQTYIDSASLYKVKKSKSRSKSKYLEGTVKGSRKEKGSLYSPLDPSKHRPIKIDL